MTTKLRTFNSVELDFVHSPFTPEGIREEDGIKVVIKNENEEWLGDLFEYSPMGLTVKSSLKDVRLNKGTKLVIDVFMGGVCNSHTGIVLDEVVKGDHFFYGIRTFYKVDRSDIAVDERETKRWTCSSFNLPVGSAPNPMKFNDHIFFKVDDISAGGFRLRMSMRNKMLARGMRLDANISLPMVGSIQAPLEIRYIKTETLDGKSEMIAGAKFIDKDEVLNMSLAEYILNFAENVTLKSLIDDGFKIKKFTKLLDFNYVKTEDDYNNVLKLRYEAFKLAGKLDQTTNLQDMGDQFDANARIIIVKFKGIILGTCRFSFYEKDKDSCLGQQVSFPESFPPIKQIMEASRACVDFSARGGKILENIVMHGVLTTIKSGRRYIMVGVSGTLVQYYLDCGFERTGTTFENTRMANTVTHLLILDTFKVCYGDGINLRTWATIFGSLVDYMLEKELIIPSTGELLKLKSKKTMAKFLRYL